MFKIVKRYFDLKIYDENDVLKFVEAGRITDEEYKSITGKDLLK